jgi:hypothetical protein
MPSLYFISNVHEHNINTNARCLVTMICCTSLLEQDFENFMVSALLVI